MDRSIDTIIKDIEIFGIDITDKEAIVCLQEALFALHRCKLALNTTKLETELDQQFAKATSSLDEFLSEDCNKNELKYALDMIGKSIGLVASNPDRTDHLASLLNYRSKVIKRLGETQ